MQPSECAWVYTFNTKTNVAKYFTNTSIFHLKISYGQWTWVLHNAQKGGRVITKCNTDCFPGLVFLIWRNSCQEKLWLCPVFAPYEGRRGCFAEPEVVDWRICVVWGESYLSVLAFIVGYNFISSAAVDIRNWWILSTDGASILLMPKTNITFVIFYLKRIIFMQKFHHEYQAIDHFVEKGTSCHFIFNKKEMYWYLGSVTWFSG